MKAAENRMAIGVDVGGTKIDVGLVDHLGRILEEAQESTDQSGPLGPVEQIVRLIREVTWARTVDLSDLAGVGIGVPGMPDTGNGGVWAPNVRGWTDFPLARHLTERLGVPVVVENDGRTAALGECWCGAGRGARSVALIVVGTGIGGGAVVDGELIRGRHGVAGAFGWFVIPGVGPRRPDLGDLESLAAGPVIGEQARKLAAAGDSPSMLEIAGSVDKITGRTAFAAAAGDPAARRLVRKWAEHLAMGIANLVVVLDPDVIIIGGGVAANFAQFEPDLRDALAKYAHPFARNELKIVPAGLGPRAGVIGAARLALYSFERK